MLGGVYSRTPNTAALCVTDGVKENEIKQPLDRGGNGGAILGVPFAQ